MIDILSFERALNGNAVKVIHSVNNGEFGGETMIMWNPEKGGLQSWYFTSAGSLTIQNVQIKKSNNIYSVLSSQTFSPHKRHGD